MRPRICLRGSVCLSVRPSVRITFLKTISDAAWTCFLQPTFIFIFVDLLLLLIFITFFLYFSLRCHRSFSFFTLTHTFPFIMTLILIMILIHIMTLILIAFHTLHLLWLSLTALSCCLVFFAPFTTLISSLTFILNRSFLPLLLLLLISSSSSSSLTLPYHRFVPIRAI